LECEFYQRVHEEEEIEQSLDGVGRVAKIISAMKEFSHPGTGQKEPTDIRKRVRNTSSR
jgi:hypothetical protein